MGKGEKPGAIGSKWTTIILILVLVILIGIFVWISATGGLESFFHRFRQKRKPLPPLKPEVHQQFRILSDQDKLESIDSRLRVIAELSWNKTA